MAKPEEVKHRFIELRALGRSYAAICKELQITKRTAVDWGRQLEQEIARLKAIELEGLYESYGLQKEARIKALGGMLQRMEAELAQRDLTKVNTGRLLELYLTYHQIIELQHHWQLLNYLLTQNYYQLKKQHLNPPDESILFLVKQKNQLLAGANQIFLKI